MFQTGLPSFSRDWEVAFWTEVFNLLKPTGHVMSQQFNIQQFYILPTLYLFFIFIWEQTATCATLKHKLIGFCNRDEKCLLRGTNWIFK